MNAVAMAGMLRQQDGIVTPDSDDNARRNLRIIAFTAVAAEHGPLGFARVHGMPAVAAVFMRSVKLGQLHATACQLEQAHIEIQHLTNGSHVLAARLLDQPHRLPLPLADLQRRLTNEIETIGSAIGYFPTGQP